MTLDDARLFIALAKAGSLSETARRLDRSVAAISGALKRLESLTRVRLVRRSTRAMALTTEGLAFLQTCEQLVAAWEEGERRLENTRDELAGSLRLAAPVDIAHQHVASLVADFVAAHPGVCVTLVVDDAYQALPGEDVDVALRYGQLEDSTLVGTRIGASARVVVAAPTLLERVGTPSHPRALEQLPTLAWMAHGRPYTRWILSRGRERATVETTPILCGDGALARRWAVEGRGFALKSRLDVIDDLAAGRLVEPFPAWRGANVPITALVPAGRMRAARVDALVSHLRKGMRARL